MVIEFEHDEDRFLYRWENVWGSEDYELVEDDDEEEESRNGDYEIDRFSDIVRELQDIAPHIRWRITYAGIDFDNGSGKRWRVMCVLESQETEAEYILERYKAREDLSNYSYKDRYPDLYVTVSGEKELHPDVETFVRILEKVVNLKYPSNRIDTVSLLLGLRELLPQLYHAGTRLPRVSNAGDYCGNRNESFDFDFGRHEWFFCVDDPYGNKPTELILSSLSRRVDLVIAGIMAKCLDIDVEKV